MKHRPWQSCFLQQKLLLQPLLFPAFQAESDQGWRLDGNSESKINKWNLVPRLTPWLFSVLPSWRNNGPIRFKLQCSRLQNIEWYIGSVLISFCYWDMIPSVCLSCCILYTGCPRLTSSHLLRKCCPQSLDMSDYLWWTNARGSSAGSTGKLHHSRDFAWLAAQTIPDFWHQCISCIAGMNL